MKSPAGRAHSGSPKTPSVLRVVTLGSSTGRYGGPFDTALRQARLTTRLGFPTTLAYGYEAGDKPNVSSTDGTRIEEHRVRDLTRRGAFRSMMSFAMLRSLWATTARSDLVHLSIARELIPLAALAIARLRGVPVLLQPHGMLTGKRGRVHRLVDLLVLRPLIGGRTEIIALTSREEGQLGAWLAGRRPEIHVVGNPLPPNIDFTAGARPRGHEALFLARLHPRKRVVDFVGASVLASGRGWVDKYVVVGPADANTPLDASLARGNFSYEGAIPGAAVVSRVADCDVFVLPARDEPWGNVLVLALALGKPVVVTESTALANLIRQEGAGIVVSDESPEELAVAVHSLLSAPDSDYEQYSEGALNFAAKYLDQAAQATRIDAIYRGLMGTSTTRRRRLP